jgi:hypothetical protein
MKHWDIEGASKDSKSLYRAAQRLAELSPTDCAESAFSAEGGLGRCSWELL